MIYSKQSCYGQICLNILTSNLTTQSLNQAEKKQRKYILLVPRTVGELKKKMYMYKSLWYDKC